MYGKEINMGSKIKACIIGFCQKYTDKTACILACLHFIISFWTDRFLFTYDLADLSSPLMTAKSLLAWGCKAAFFVVVVALYNYIFYLVKKAPREYVRFVGIYFIFMVLLLFLTYPGIWRMDEFGILFTAGEAFFEFWQNYLTSLFYIVALMICPLPANVVLLQCFVISSLVGSILYGIWQLGLIRGKWIYALYLPFLCFPVLDSNLYPMRMSVYAYLELYMLVRLVLLRIKSMRGQQLACRDFISLLFIVPVVISLRTEAVYYFVAFPVCFLVFFADKLPRSMLRRLLCAIMALSLIVFIPQQLGSRLRNGKEYTLTSVVLPIVPLVYEARGELDRLLQSPPSKQDAFRQGLSAKEQRAEKLRGLLADIDQVINVDVAIAGYEEGKNGIALYWSEETFTRNYSDEQFRTFQTAYHKLILMYPKIFMKERIQTFLESGDLLENTTVIFDADGVPNHERFAAMMGNRPFSVKVRNAVICALELRRQGDYTHKLAAYTPVYHVMLPLLFLMGLLFYLCAKKSFACALLLAAHLCKVPLIFLTAPSRLFMYYYPVYLTGVFAMAVLAVWLCGGQKTRL